MITSAGGLRDGEDWWITMSLQVTGEQTAKFDKFWKLNKP